MEDSVSPPTRHHTTITPFERSKTELVKVCGKVNPLVKVNPSIHRFTESTELTHRVDSAELTESPASHRCRSPAATAELTSGEGGGDDFRRRRVNDTREVDETCGGAYGFVRTPIEARSAATASSRREEHDDGLGCTRFTTRTVVTSSTWSRGAVAPVATQLAGVLSFLVPMLAWAALVAFDM
ncbi:hypothetical protein F2Q69_00043326 [Brassica cretica]|uniref:Uncharacterized protein n=1 Tax=Brassica cretica TaxID=69181 RepID=A0A8S9NDZ6_BRACR|nr:hypothetical protein F2Q69_00043326 [Brassica cretica]